MADPTDATDGDRESNADLLTELVAHLRNNRTQLRQEWARRIAQWRRRAEVFLKEEAAIKGYTVVDASTVVATHLTEVLKPIEAGSHRYTYRGHPMIKNPFDMALYPLLLWNVKPATIFPRASIG